MAVWKGCFVGEKMRTSAHERGQSREVSHTRSVTRGQSREVSHARSVTRGKSGEGSLSCVCFCGARATQAS